MPEKRLLKSGSAARSVIAPPCAFFLPFFFRGRRHLVQPPIRTLCVGLISLFLCLFSLIDPPPFPKCVQYSANASTCMDVRLTAS